MRPGLLRHRKLLRAARILNLPASYVVGMLVVLWESCYETGDPYLGSSADVEQIAQWPGESGTLAKVLAECGEDGPGFIEPSPEHLGHWQVHDLFDHAPDYVFKRLERELQRKREAQCPQCGQSFRSRDPRKHFCSHACRTRAWRQNRTINPRDGSVTDHPSQRAKCVTGGDGSAESVTASEIRAGDGSRRIVTERDGTHKRPSQKKARKIGANGGGAIIAPLFPHPNPSPEAGEETPQESVKRTPPLRVDRKSFDLFWGTWPKKVAKQDAIKAWTKLAPNAALQETILAAIAAQKQSRPWHDGFVPHPATWLNGRRWEDEIEPFQEPCSNGSPTPLEAWSFVLREIQAGNSPPDFSADPCGDLVQTIVDRMGGWDYLTEDEHALISHRSHFTNEFKALRQSPHAK